MSTKLKLWTKEALREARVDLEADPSLDLPEAAWGAVYDMRPNDYTTAERDQVVEAVEKQLRADEREDDLKAALREYEGDTTALEADLDAISDRLGGSE